MAVAREDACAPQNGKRLFGTRLPGLFKQQGFHIGEDEAGIEGGGAVDVSNAGLAVDKENAKGVEKRALGIIWVGAFVDGLIVGGEDGG
jgi:hypothetical protein